MINDAANEVSFVRLYPSDTVFYIKKMQTVNHDNTISWDSQIIQIPLEQQTLGAKIYEPVRA